MSCASIRLEDTYKQRVGWMLADAISHPLLQWACTPESVSKLAENTLFSTSRVVNISGAKALMHLLQQLSTKFAR